MFYFIEDTALRSSPINNLGNVNTTLNIFFRHEVTKELTEHTAKNDSLEKEKTALVDEMKSVREQKEEKIKVIKEKSKKWDDLQQQKDEVTAKFDKVRKQDESLHAELVETNKRRKTHMASIKMVIFHCLLL